MTQHASPQARRILAGEVERLGPAWRNAADSIRAGAYANAWTVAGLAAIDEALKQGPDDVAD